MLEIEQKFVAPEFAELEKRLAGLGARECEAHDEADQYLNAPDRDFAVTGEAFRLRHVGAKSNLTYKGVKSPDTVKVRAELEVPLADGDKPAADCLALLKNLGYRPVAIVRKHRRSFQLQRAGFDITVCLDEVDRVGRYAEVEVLAPEEQRSAATAAVCEVAASLGLTQVERRSYLGLFLAAQA
jgi:adenylate cyclase class 2